MIDFVDNKPNPNAVFIEEKKDFSTVEKSFMSVGLNTGNLLFREALFNNLNLLSLDYRQYCENFDQYKDLPIVLTDLIWINEKSDFGWLIDRVEHFSNTRFIPISVGIQAKNYDFDFKLNSSSLRVLSAIQERSIIGVRGEYTANVLEKHGIKNYRVIGCPSLFYGNNPNLIIHKSDKKLKKVNVNFRTFYGLLSIEEKHFLTYCANRNYDFTEQTKYVFSKENANDDKYFSYVGHWLNSHKKIFFDAIEWKNDNSQYDFSIGARFHGNVVSLWNENASLFIVIDSRTEELVKYFKLPYIRMADFDDTKPIEYYYDLANYEDFNASYQELFMNYRAFLTDNGLI